MALKILLLGSGGREHALAWKLSQSPLVSCIYVVPGNGGTASVSSKVVNIPDSQLRSADSAALLKFAVEKEVGLLVPGPEAPLVHGVVDYFKANGPASIACFGPSKAAARIEGSKAFAKDLMRRHNVPTAIYKTFTSFTEAESFLKQNESTKWVLKADGLAAGKGVIIPETQEEALAALKSIMLDKEFGSAGETVVIEEYLEGEELSILTFSDGQNILSLPAAQDHKRIFDGDQGPNTGGMGCYAPAPVATPEIMRRIHGEALQPTIDAMRKGFFPFMGCLFTGFMLTKQGPKVLEYNVRLGDPESQTLLPLMETDLAEVMLRCTQHCLDGIRLKVKSEFSTTVVVAAGGYPGKYDNGVKMSVDAPPEDVYHFHAGTAFDDKASTLSTAGGRVIASTALGSNITSSVGKAYNGVSCIHFDRMQYRKDIAHRALHRQQQLHKSFQTTPTTSSKDPLTYDTAGVSLSSSASLIQNIRSLVAKTAIPGSKATIGGFAGSFSLRDAGYDPNSPDILSCIDGVGTKLLVAQATGIYDTVGIDLVAMNVNDLVVQGAKPTQFLDYFACSHLDVGNATEFVSGVVEGCLDAGCVLSGGETAEMPGLYGGEGKGDFDAAGCAIGAMQYGTWTSKPLPHIQRMQEGDVLLGLGSSGPHSNGYSLIRKVVSDRSGLSYTDPAPWDLNVTLGRALLEPTKIYVKSLLHTFATCADESQQIPAIKGAAHITGGGLYENVPRILPNDLAARFDAKEWKMPETLRWIKKIGSIANEEFANVFNTGLGMVLVVESKAVEEVVEELEKFGEKVYVVGSLSKRNVDQKAVVIDNMEVWEF